MSKEGVRVTVEPAFYSLAKFNGDPEPKPEGISDHESLARDLLNPNCIELIVGGQGRPTQVWRK
jgi:hypothetical protein